MQPAFCLLNKISSLQLIIVQLR